MVLKILKFKCSTALTQVHDLTISLLTSYENLFLQLLSRSCIFNTEFQIVHTTHKYTTD